MGQRRAAPGFSPAKVVKGERDGLAAGHLFQVFGVAVAFGGNGGGGDVDLGEVGGVEPDGGGCDVLFEARKLGGAGDGDDLDGAAGLQREVIYRLLLNPQGRHLRAIATLGEQSHRTARAVEWVRLNYAKPLRIEELASTARMGVSTLHHQFRSLTAMSPLQYQKQLRLHVARERMLNEGLDAASAAFEVGYESASQFNREYSRFFGMPPMRDIKARLSAGAAVVGG